MNKGGDPPWDRTFSRTLKTLKYGFLRHLQDSLKSSPSICALPEGSAQQRDRKGVKPLWVPALPPLAGCSAGSSRAK